MKLVLDFRSRDVAGSPMPGKITRIDGHTSVPNDVVIPPGLVTFLLHGFNVNRQNGMDSLTELQGMLPSVRGGTIVAVLWPGDSHAGVLGYSFQGRDADDTSAHFVRFIHDNIARDSRLNFVTHSLGARVAMETIKKLSKNYIVNEVCLMAAAINDYSLTVGRDYRDAAARANRVSVLASKKDRVLGLAYPAGNLLQSFIYLKDRPGLALGYHGPVSRKGRGVPENVHSHIISNQSRSRHGDYLPGEPVNPNQRSAIGFADQALNSIPLPKYN